MSCSLIHRSIRSLWNDLALRLHYYLASICPYYRGGIIFWVYWINISLDAVFNNHQMIWVLSFPIRQLIPENSHRSFCRRTGVVAKTRNGNVESFPKGNSLLFILSALGLRTGSNLKPGKRIMIFHLGNDSKFLFLVLYLSGHISEQYSGFLFSYHKLRITMIYYTNP